MLGRAHGLSGVGTSATARALTAESPEAFFQSLYAHWALDEPLVRDVADRTPITNAVEWFPNNETPARLMFMELVSRLPDYILVWVDRTTMAASLEARCPLLDYRLAELTARLPTEWKVSRHTGKSILRRLLYSYVPQHLVDRPKRGFGAPIGTWLRGDLKAWADDLLDPSLIRRSGFLNVEPVRKKWRDHLDGRAMARMNSGMCSCFNRGWSIRRRILSTLLNLRGSCGSPMT